MSIRKRQNPKSISYFVDYRDIDGRRIRKAVGPSKLIARIVARKIKDDLARAKWAIPIRTKETLAGFIQDFCERMKVERSPQTALWYAHKLRQFLEFTGDKRLHAVNMQAIDDFKIMRLGKVSPRTVAGDLRTLNAFFNQAVRQGLIQDNPCKYVTKPRRTAQKLPNFLRQEEIERLLQVLEGTHLYGLVATGIYAGLRKSELVWLEWKDVDFERKTLTVQGKEGWHTKSYRSRVVPLHPRLKETLEALPRKGRWCFVNSAGSQYLNNLGRDFQKALKPCGLKCGWHTLRHTFASHLVMAGVDLTTVKELLGHSSITTTMIYAHLAPEHLRGAVERLKFI